VREVVFRVGGIERVPAVLHICGCKKKHEKSNARTDKKCEVAGGNEGNECVCDCSHILHITRIIDARSGYTRCVDAVGNVELLFTVAKIDRLRIVIELAFGHAV